MATWTIAIFAILFFMFLLWQIVKLVVQRDDLEIELMTAELEIDRLNRRLK
jgi:hypothetical protein